MSKSLENTKIEIKEPTLESITSYVEPATSHVISITFNFNNGKSYNIAILKGATLKATSECMLKVANGLHQEWMRNGSES